MCLRLRSFLDRLRCLAFRTIERPQIEQISFCSATKIPLFQEAFEVHSSNHQQKNRTHSQRYVRNFFSPIYQVAPGFWSVPFRLTVGIQRKKLKLDNV